ncbi:sulfotransferase domain-containing protein [Coraliomargarita parva]|uniref:sulfotransferase domain-containing protein n=1 Tax=Coraliomargarita parva TaxID=3014050 RepID=UPI0022B2F543|nr:sulfotransferase domain-containing protein [Coraliomargarita parva]
MSGKNVKRKILICGYPKSGNTWLTRLTAEIVGCPVSGYWDHPNANEIGIEGQERVSSFECYKAHHSYDALMETLQRIGNGQEKIIYIWRDPRDVVVSATHYFKPQLKPLDPRIFKLLRVFPGGKALYRKCFMRDQRLQKLMAEGLILGSSLNFWLQIPWHEHVRGYEGRRDVLHMSYESMLRDPLSCAREICRFLGLKRSDCELEEAVRMQSFDSRKSAFEQEGNTRQTTFLRNGRAGAWESELSEQNRHLIESKLSEPLRTLGYL